MSQTEDIVPHHSVKEVGHKPFHLEIIDYGRETAQLHIIVLVGGTAEEWIVDYDIPDGFLPIVKELAKQTPLHMIGFEEQDGQLFLADARSIWGYVCPCTIDR